MLGGVSRNSIDNSKQKTLLASNTAMHVNAVTNIELGVVETTPPSVSALSQTHV